MSFEAEKMENLPSLDDASMKMLDEARVLYNEFIQGRMRAGNLPGESDRSPRGQAIERLNKILEKYPDDPRPLLFMGIIHHGMGELPQAETCLRKAQEGGVSTPDLHRTLAEIYIEREAYTEAEKHIDFIKKNDPTRPEIYELKAEIALRKQDWDSRLDALNRMADITPNDDRVAVAIASTLIKKGNEKEAHEKLLEVNEQIPNSSEINFILGNLLTDHGKLNEAKKYYTKVLELNPDHNLARFELANILDEQGHHKESLELYREYIGVIRTDPDAYYNAAGVAERLEDRALAVRYYLEFLKLTDDEKDFDDVYDWINKNALGFIDPAILIIELARAHLAQDDPEAALKELATAGEVGIHDRRTDFLKGKAHFDLEDYKTALSFFKKAMEQEDPGDLDGFSDDEVLLAAGEASLELGDFNDALETATELLTGDLAEQAHTLRGDVYLEQENYDLAKEEFLKAIRTNLFSFDGMFGLGEVLDSRDDYQNASKCYRLCLEIDPDDEDTLYCLGMDLYRLGHKEWAKHYFDSLRKKPDFDQSDFEIPVI